MSCLRLPYWVQLVTLFRLRATLQLRVFTALVNRPIWSVLCASTIIVPLKLEFFTVDQAHHKLYRPISKASVGRRNRTPVKWASGDCLDHIDFIVNTVAGGVQSDGESRARAGERDSRGRMRRGEWSRCRGGGRCSVPPPPHFGARSIINKVLIRKHIFFFS